MGSELALHADNVKIDTSATNGVSSNTAIGYMSLSDKDDYWAGRVGAYVHSNGSTVSYLGAQNKKTDGTDVTNYIQAGVTKAGDPYYWMTSPAAFRKALDIVNILTLKSPSTSSAKIDKSTNNGATSSAVVFGRTEIMDKNGTWVSTYGSNTQTNGQTRSYIGCNNMKTDGTMATNYLNIGVNKDGSAYYGVTDPAAFRKAIGGIGTRKNVVPDAVSCPNNTWTETMSVSLEAGMWIVLYGGSFAANATGHRDLHIGTSAPGAGRVSPTAVAVTGGEQTRMNSAITYNPGSTTTYKLYARQNSGGALNFWPYIQAVKVG